MPGALDSAFRKAAEAIVKDFADGLDIEIDYIRKVSDDYDVATGTYTKLDKTFFGIKCPIEFVSSQEEEGREEHQAKVYISPSQINDNQPTLADEVSLKFQGAVRNAQVVNVKTFKGGQDYLYVLLLRF